MVFFPPPFFFASLDWFVLPRIEEKMEKEQLASIDDAV